MSKETSILHKPKLQMSINNAVLRRQWERMWMNERGSLRERMQSWWPGKVYCPTLRSACGENTRQVNRPRQLLSVCMRRHTDALISTSWTIQSRAWCKIRVQPRPRVIYARTLKVWGHHRGHWEGTGSKINREIKLYNSVLAPLACIVFFYTFTFKFSKQAYYSGVQTKKKSPSGLGHVNFSKRQSIPWECI